MPIFEVHFRSMKKTGKKKKKKKMGLNQVVMVGVYFGEIERKAP